MITAKTTATLGVVLFFVAISAATQFSTPNIADPDSFYHIAHAKIYRERGLLYTEFPWAQFSVIKELKADIWYGFHLFLIPFTYVKDGILGIKLAGAFITFLTLAGFYWTLNRLKIKWPLVWVLIFVVASPDVLYRLTMARPHNLTLALALMVFVLALTSGRAAALATVGALTSFLHIALGWLPVFITAVTGLALKQRKEPTQWKNIVYVATGAIVGAFLRPNPLGALKLTYIQVVQIMLVKLKKIPLQFGRELQTPAFDMFARNTLPTLLLLTAALVAYKIVSRRSNDADSKNQKNIIFSALAVSAVFFFVTALVARRSYDIFIGFGLIAASAALTIFITALDRDRNMQPQVVRKTKNAALSALVVVIGLLALNSVPLFKTYNHNAWVPTYLKESSLWLKENAKPGEMVFHTGWDQFGSLFFWNQNNHYINGMDPIFMYAYNPSLYWKNHFMFTDEAYNQTCGKIRCAQEEAEDTAKALTDDFKADYVILRKAQNPKTFTHWVAEGTFPLVFENKTQAVFKVPHLDRPSH